MAVTKISLRLADWPERDRALWLANTTRGNPFDHPNPANRLAAPSIKKAAHGYGRWLGFLAAHGWLDPGAHPPDRVTRERLLMYFEEMRANGNRDHTVVGRFQELHCAMRILAPERDMSWIRRPFGRTVRSVLTMGKRNFPVPDSKVVFDWALELMDAAAAALEIQANLVPFRDGLLLAMLASRGRRSRAMAGIRIDHELIRVGDHYRIELPPELVKTKRRDHFDLPIRLTPYIDLYLAKVRPALLAGRQSDWLWITNRGGRQSQKSMSHQVAARTARAFGTGFGPHRFRYAITTSAALRAPSCPGLAVGVLATSSAVLEEHYNRAGQIEATLRFNKLTDGT